MVPSLGSLSADPRLAERGTLPLAGSWAVVRRGTAEGRLPWVPLVQHGGECLCRTHHIFSSERWPPAFGLKGMGPSSRPVASLEALLLLYACIFFAHGSKSLIVYNTSSCSIIVWFLSPDCTMKQKY